MNVTKKENGRNGTDFVVAVVVVVCCWQLAASQPQFFVCLEELYGCGCSCLCLFLFISIGAYSIPLSKLEYENDLQ